MGAAQVTHEAVQCASVLHDSQVPLSHHCAASQSSSFVQPGSVVSVAVSVSGSVAVSVSLSGTTKSSGCSNTQPAQARSIIVRIAMVYCFIFLLPLKSTVDAQSTEWRNRPIYRCSFFFLFFSLTDLDAPDGEKRCC